MIPIPDPLHPAVVHFPIALLIVGAGLSVIAVLFRRWAPAAALLLVLGAAGAVVAVGTGESEDDRLGKLQGAAHQLLEDHEHAGERARNFALVAAALSVLALLAARWSLLGRSIGALAAVVALMTAWNVAQAGHYGGLLVYHQGIGLREVPAMNKK